MKKKGQFSKPIAFVIAGITAAVIIIIGYALINSLLLSSEKRELANFISSLKNTAEKYSSGPQGSYGSVNDKVLSLPARVSEVCFIDGSKKVNRLANNELNGWIGNFPESNLFIYPFSKFGAFKVDYISAEENPACIKASGGKIKLRLTSKGGFVEIGSLAPEEREEDCVSIVYNEEPKDAVDIVFLGYAYENKNEFGEDVNKYINDVFLEIEPFKSNKNKLNFYRIDKFESIECSIQNWISCDGYKASQIASYCPNDYIFILAERNKMMDLLRPIRSSSISNMASINTADKAAVLMHEFGHSFGKLADEYVDESYYLSIDFDEEDYANCDKSPCSEWSGITDGCYEGCSIGRYSRPTKTSIMRSLRSADFGIVSGNEIIKRLGAYEK